MSELPKIPIDNWEAAEHWAEQQMKPSSDEVAALRRGIREISDQCTQFEDQLTATQSRIAQLEDENNRMRELIQLHEPDCERLEFCERELVTVTSDYLRTVTSTIEKSKLRIVELQQLLTRCLPVLNAYDCGLEADELYDEVRKALSESK